jgi:hypothetical protein
MHMKKIILRIIGPLTVWAIFGMATTFASNSTVSQEIIPIDCILTTVNNGSTQVVGSCPAEQPEVIEVGSTASGARFIRGTFDGTKTAMFKVTFRGVTYVANTANSPLRLAGDIWTFALDELTPFVEEGNYIILLEGITFDGDTVTNSVSVAIPSRASGQPDPGFVPLPTGPGTPQTSGGNGLLPIAEIDGSQPTDDVDQFGRLPRSYAYDFAEKIAVSMLVPVVLVSWALPLIIAGIILGVRALYRRFVLIFSSRKRQ